MKESKSNGPRRTLAVRSLDAPISPVSRGRKIPASSTLGIPKAQVDPVEGERLQATGDRYERHLHFYLKPQVSSLKPSTKRDKIGTNHLPHPTTIRRWP